MSDNDSLETLLVEDNPGDTELIKRHLGTVAVEEISGHVELAHVETLEEALAELDDTEYDLVLLDLGLPGTTGLETLDRVESAIDHTPIVVLTGIDDSETALEAIQHGAQDYLPKGALDGPTLARSIRYAIEREKQARKLRERTAQLEFFNSVLRHDVGNGMDVIRRNAELLADSATGPDEERAETILTWSNDIIELTEKVRRMLVAVATDGEDRLEPVDVVPIVREKKQAIEGMDRQVSVALSTPESAVVTADELLADVVHNVLTNAVEHNDSEGVHIRIDVETGDGTVTIRITDDGPGIPARERERIRTLTEDLRAGDGGGFGLYFVVTMVDSYGGTVSLTDDDPGTVVTIELPAATAATGW